MNKIKTTILFYICAIVSLGVNAQNVNVAQNNNISSNNMAFVAADSVVSGIPATVDSTLVGTSVMDLISAGGSSVEINRSVAVDTALVQHVKNNVEKVIHGYRIRIFFDNKQTARVQSEEIEKLFIENYPQYPVYRTYTNPYFKVAVGDCRTKSDATRLLKEIEGIFPNAFIIRDVINYPL